jgi:hypothetical protein
MGYAAYETSRGLAGYGVDDVCHAEGCDEAIDRGLAYLCGAHPHSPDPGCGWWFCSGHLYVWGDDGCDYLCKTCMDEAQDELA